MKRSVFAWGLLALLTVFSMTALAGDINGKWKAEYTTPNGDKRESVFSFKADGSKLTGTVSSARGESEISDGTINADEVSFNVVRNFNGNEFKIKYTGKIVGDELKLKMTMREDRTMEVTAKRVPVS